MGMDRGSIQRTALRGLLLSSQEGEGGRVRGRSNVPVEEEGQEAEQEYCRGELPNRANPIKQKDQVTEHFCHTWELQLPKVDLNRLVLKY